MACLYSVPYGSLSSHLSLREGSEPPLFPRASSCRIGPRRQGFASPLRALDGSGPIRKTRCLRGEREVVGSDRVDGPKGSLSVIPGLLAGVLILVLGLILLSVRLSVPPRYAVSLLLSVLYL